MRPPLRYCLLLLSLAALNLTPARATCVNDAPGTLLNETSTPGSFTMIRERGDSYSILAPQERITLPDFVTLLPWWITRALGPDVTPLSSPPEECWLPPLLSESPSSDLPRAADNPNRPDAADKARLRAHASPSAPSSAPLQISNRSPGGSARGHGAFRSPGRRGHGDFLGSADLEDVMRVIAGVSGLLEELRTVGDLVHESVRSGLGTLLTKAAFLDAIPGFFEGDKATQSHVGPFISELRRAAAG